MSTINPQDIADRQSGRKKRYEGANVWFTNEYVPNHEETLKHGRPIETEIPSFNIQWPGQDHTCRRIEEQDKVEYPELYKAFMAGDDSSPCQGTPLDNWSMMPRVVCRELKAIGIRSVDQLAVLTDDVKRKIGIHSKYVGMAQEWLESANAGPNQIVAKNQQIEKLEKRLKSLEEQNLLLMKRIESNEGTRLHNDSSGVNN